VSDDLNAEWRRWLIRFNTVMRQGAKLTALSKDADLDVYGLIGQLNYARLETRRLEVANELSNRIDEGGEIDG
jgi:hypothetical protein